MSLSTLKEGQWWKRVLEAWKGSVAAVEGIREDLGGGDARAERRHTMDTVPREADERSIGLYQQQWVAWPVAWSAVWVGALTALAAALLIGFDWGGLGRP